MVEEEEPLQSLVQMHPVRCIGIEWNRWWRRRRRKMRKMRKKIKRVVIVVVVYIQLLLNNRFRWKMDFETM